MTTPVQVLKDKIVSYIEDAGFEAIGYWQAIDLEDSQCVAEVKMAMRNYIRHNAFLTGDDEVETPATTAQIEQQLAAVEEAFLLIHEQIMQIDLKKQIQEQDAVQLKKQQMQTYSQADWLTSNWKDPETQSVYQVTALVNVNVDETVDSIMCPPTLVLINIATLQMFSIPVQNFIAKDVQAVDL